ncbi:MAG: DEAD/DEAH box helicase [Deltaproteobacteria bacterium]|nr:DEAD/DEAH box helicase [Deltaproteobacteria bacterium]
MQYRGLELDAFQETAIQHLQGGASVLVSAPTGTGKTVIADWIVDKALAEGKRVIYTAPVKALSNQKYRDYIRIHGESKVGLVTGDLVIRREAACLVMTTEILRNMLLSGEKLEDLAAVILDEIHFLDDRERGTVWEEVLLYLPRTVQIVGLSATLSNLEEFASWLEEVRERPVEVVVENKRAVPLQVLYASPGRQLQKPELFEQGLSHVKVKKKDRRDQRDGRRDRRGNTGIRHSEIFQLASEAGLLPYLFFVFSRKNTELFALNLARNLRSPLLDRDEQADMDGRLRVAARALGPVLDPGLRDLYASGVAFHHAGLHVQLKSLVEELYEAKLIKVLYCTTTFALGINMPARAAVIDSLDKFDGKDVVPLTTREFMQMAGRAGRRGMDTTGSVILKVSEEDYPKQKAILNRLRAGAPEPVISRFNLSWNSVVNLIGNHDEEQLKILVGKSFLNWHLSQEAERSLKLAEELEEQAQQPGGRGQFKEVKRLRRVAARRGERCWSEFQTKVNYLQKIGYIAEDRTFNAGARILQHLQIAEIALTEMILAGTLDGLSREELFGVLCGLGSQLPRAATLNLQPRSQDRQLLRDIGALMGSPMVQEAAEIAQLPVEWCPSMFEIGRRWAEGESLQDLFLHVSSPTDISGDLITAFRRAKDLTSQIRQVYREIPEQAEALTDLIWMVSRDEVEVVG